MARAGRVDVSQKLTYKQWRSWEHSRLGVMIWLYVMLGLELSGVGIESLFEWAQAAFNYALALLFVGVPVFLAFGLLGGLFASPKR